MPAWMVSLALRVNKAMKDDEVSLVSKEKLVQLVHKELTAL